VVLPTVLRRINLGTWIRRFYVRLVLLVKMLAVCCFTVSYVTIVACGFYSSTCNIHVLRVLLLLISCVLLTHFLVNQIGITFSIDLLYYPFQMKPTGWTLVLSIFISTSVHVSGNCVTIIRRTYFIYATQLFFVLGQVVNFKNCKVLCHKMQNIIYKHVTKCQ